MMLDRLLIAWIIVGTITLIVVCALWVRPVTITVPIPPQPTQAQYPSID